METITTERTRVNSGIAGQFSRLKYKQQLLAIFSLLLVCIFFWIAASLFSSQQKSKLTPELAKMAKPFNPVLKAELLDTVMSKKMYTQEELQSFSIFVLNYDKVTQSASIVPYDAPGVE